MTSEDARERFAAARVARLATADSAGVPHLVPITFAVRADLIVFAVDDKPKDSVDLRRLRNIAANPAVTVLVDVYEEDWTRLWWARADGLATVAREDAARADSLRALCAKYPVYARTPPRGPVVHIAVTRWSGWSADS